MLWNSSYFEVEQQQSICAALLELRRGELIPSDSEFAAMSDFLTAMKPLVQIIKALGGEEWITITVCSLSYISFSLFIYSFLSES